jgi:hypothetical protein
VPRSSDAVTDYYSSPSPTSYFNAGFVAYSADYFSAGMITETLPSRETVAASCTTGPTTEFALIPTVTPPGFSDPYQAPVAVDQWVDMVPASLSKCYIPLERWNVERECTSCGKVTSGASRFTLS